MRENMYIENRDGAEYVAVVLSAHRVGWATWNRNHRLATDPRVVELVQAGAAPKEIEARAREIYPNGHFTAAHLSDRLHVRWVPLGRPFRVVYDPTEGGETIEFYQEEEWICG